MDDFRKSLSVVLSEAKDLIAASSGVPLAIAMRSFASLRMTGWGVGSVSMK
jgi:hypothetical protein